MVLPSLEAQEAQEPAQVIDLKIPDYSTALAKLADMLPFKAREGELLSGVEPAPQWSGGNNSPGPQGSGWALVLDGGGKKTIASTTLSNPQQGGRSRKIVLAEYPGKLRKEFGTTFLDPDKRWEWSYSGLPIAGRELINAAICYQIGQTDIANEIAHVILSRSPDARAAIDAAISIIASADYNVAITQFETNEDWALFLKRLNELIANYPRGWSGHGAMQILARRVEGVVDGKDSIIPKLSGVTFSEREKLKAKQMIETWQKESLGPANLLEDEPAKGPAVSLRDMAVLIGLLDNETPVLQKRSRQQAILEQSYEGITTSMLMMGSDSRSEAEKALAYYKQMRRPKTVGEIAKLLLQDLLQDRQQNVSYGRSSYRYDEDAESQFKDSTYQLWSKLSKSSPIKQSQILMERDESRKEAQAYFLDNASEEQVAELKKKIMAKPLENVTLIVSLIRQGGSDATDLYQALDKAASDLYELDREVFFQTLVNENLQNLPASFGRYLNSGEQLKNAIRALEIHTKNYSFQEVLEKFSAGEMSADVVVKQMKAEAEKISFDQAFSLCLKCMADTNDLKLRSELMTALFTDFSESAGNDYWRLLSQGPVVVVSSLAEAEPLMELNEVDKVAWQELIKDERKLETEAQTIQMSQWTPILMGFVYGDLEPRDLMILNATFTGRGIEDYVMTEAKRFLNEGGKFKLPKPGVLETARVDALVAEYLSTPKADRGKFVDELGMLELIEFTKRRTDDKALQAAINEQATMFSAPVKGDSTWPDLEQFNGSDFNFELVEKISNLFLKRLVKKADTGYAMLTLDAFSNSWTLGSQAADYRNYYNQSIDEAVRAERLDLPQDQSSVVVILGQQSFIPFYENMPAEVIEKNAEAAEGAKRTFEAVISAAKSGNPNRNFYAFIVPRPFLSPEEKAKDNFKNKLQGLKNLLN